MIGFLRGQVIENAEGRLLVLVGPTADAGVGYSVMTPNAATYDEWLPGKKIDLHIYTHVREDSLDLYGFETRSEKELFLTLLSVNGIGPKMAMGILSKVEPSTLIHAILTENKDELTQIPGIGKKTAERVVLELADPIRKKMEAGLFGEIPRTGGGAAKSARGAGATKASGETPAIRDAKAALMGLGYRESDVAMMIKSVLEDAATPPQRAEDLIRTALQRLS